MKIWIVASEYPSEFSGGIASYVENVSGALVKGGTDVTVITRAKANYHRKLSNGLVLVGLASQYPSRAFPYNLLSYWPAFSYQMAGFVEELIERMGAPDIIECQEYGALPYYLLQRKLIGEGTLAKIPILVHCHSPSFILAEANHQPLATFPHYWVGEMEKFCISAADGLLCPSHFLAKQIAGKVFCKKKIEVIPLPQSAQVTSEIPTPSLPSTPQKPTVLYFGRLEVRKGILKALKSVEALWNAGEDFHLVLIGGDTDHAPRGTTVETLIRSRYATQIENGRLALPGPCDWENLREHILLAQVVLIPSLWENFPNTCIEAMSLGRVVLASQQGGQAELIGSDGQNGVLFDWNIPGDLAAKLRQLLKMAPAERERMGESARQRVSQYCSKEKVIPRRLEHFQSIIEEHQKPRFFPAPWLSYHLPTSLQNLQASLPAEDVLPQNPKEAEGLRKNPALALRNQNGATGKKNGATGPSVVIPYYNLGKYVREAVESALKSTVPPLEILIVDDCSTGEENLTILKELENQYPCVRVIRHFVNQGLAATRNTGVREARGEFIAFLDADDEVKPPFFEKALPVLEAYENVGFVYSWVQNFGNSQSIWPTWNAHFPYLLGHNMLTPLCVVRKKAFLEVGGNNPQFEYSLEDYECWIHLMKRGWLGVSLPECLVRYRVRTGSMLRSANERQLQYLYDLLARTHPELYQQWGHELAQLQIMNGSGIHWDHPARFYSSHQEVPWLEKGYIQFINIVRRLHNSAPARLLLKQPIVQRMVTKMLYCMGK